MQTIIAAQMSRRLPIMIDPLKYAQNAMRISGLLRVAEFDRITDKLANREGELAVELSFDRIQGKPVVEGKVSGKLVLICQRCMQAMEFEVNGDLRLGLIRDEAEIDGLLSGFEPLVVEPEPMKVKDIIEDELLLMIPMIPMHEQTQCEPALAVEQAVFVENKPVRSVNPFAELEKLKTH